MTTQSVTVRIKAEVDLLVGVWPNSTSMESIREQAIREGKLKLANLIREKGGNIVGTPTVTLIISGETHG